MNILNNYYDAKNIIKKSNYYDEKVTKEFLRTFTDTFSYMFKNNKNYKIRYQYPIFNDEMQVAIIKDLQNVRQRSEAAIYFKNINNKLILERMVSVYKHPIDDEW